MHLRWTALIYHPNAQNETMFVQALPDDLSGKHGWVTKMRPVLCRGVPEVPLSAATVGQTVGAYAILPIV
jgi:hypothetical protein